MVKELKVHFTFDLTCPFCYLAYSRLSNAIKVIRSRQRNVDIQLQFHPYILNSQLQTEEPLLPYLQKKISPKTPDGRQRYRYLSLLSNYFGQDGSSPVSFSEETTIGPTFECHRLIQYIQAVAAQEAAALAASSSSLLAAGDASKLGGPALLLTPPAPTTPSSDTDEGGVLLPPSPMPSSFSSYPTAAAEAAIPPFSLSHHHHSTKSRSYSDSSFSSASSSTSASSSSSSSSVTTTLTTPSPPLDASASSTATPTLPPHVTETLVAALFQAHYCAPGNPHAPGAPANLQRAMAAARVPPPLQARFLASPALWRAETHAAAADAAGGAAGKVDTVPHVRLCGAADADAKGGGTVLAGLKRMEDYVVALEALVRGCC